MGSSCYRCGAPVEERATFCTSCGAPQIKVTVPSASTNEPSSPPLPPGTPESIQPPAVPVNLEGPGKIRWKSYQRFAVPLSVIAGVSIAFIAPIGLLIFFGAIVYGVNRYRREHPAPLSALQGARLGAFNGLISFVVTAALVAINDHGEFRRQMMLDMQQRLGGSADPRMQDFLQWAGTNQGFLVITLVGTLVTLAIFLIVSSFAGAMTVTLSGNKRNQ